MFTQLLPEGFDYWTVPENMVVIYLFCPTESPAGASITLMCFLGRSYKKTYNILPTKLPPCVGTRKDIVIFSDVR